MTAAWQPFLGWVRVQVVVLLDGKAVTGFSFEDTVFKTTCASPTHGCGHVSLQQAFRLCPQKE